jgi:hypothetical protein
MNQIWHIFFYNFKIYQQFITQGYVEYILPWVGI